MIRELLASDSMVWQSHRGANLVCPENTLPAFQKAVELGADMIELDVRFTKDEQLVILHDPFLNRTTNGHGLVIDHTLEEIRQLDAGSWFDEAFAGTRVSTLAEVLQTLPNTLFNIELKTSPVQMSQRLVTKVLEVVTLHGAMDRVMLSSFDHVALHQARTLSASILLGALYSGRLWDPFGLAKALKLNLFHPNVEYLDFEFVQAAKERGYGVATWTIRDSVALAFATQCGVQNVIVDDLNLKTMR